MDPAVAGIPADGGGDVAVSELTERAAFGGVVLAQVVGESPELLGMAFGEGGERSTRTDGTELTVISYDDQLCPRSLDSGQETARSTSEVMAPSSRISTCRSESSSVLCSNRQESEATVRESIPAPSPRFLAACPEVRGAEHGVASAFEAVADRRQRRRFPGPGHTHHEIKTVPTHEEADCHLVLGGAQRRAETLLEPGDSVERGLLLDLRTLFARE